MMVNAAPEVVSNQTDTTVSYPVDIATGRPCRRGAATRCAPPPPSAIRPDAAEIDVDIFVHDPAGPASSWAVECRVGDEVVITGPDIRVGYTGYGIHYVPPRPPSRVLLIGDESAVPAMSNIRASLTQGTRCTVLLEVRDRRDAALLGDHEGVFLVERRGAPGAALLRAVREWGAEAGANARDDAGLYA